MKPKVSILNYGVGNIFSVCRGVEYSGFSVELISTPNQVSAAGHLILPGVGAFQSGMEGLRRGGLIDSVQKHAAQGKPLLGICLGMQMLASESEEFGLHQGLNLIPGKVVRIPKFTSDGLPQKIPFIGWASLRKPTEEAWNLTPLRDLNKCSAVYLVHSYAVETYNPNHQIASYTYGGQTICAAIKSGSVVGCQFHPEKSGPIGLSVLRAFVLYSDK